MWILPYGPKPSARWTRIARVASLSPSMSWLASLLVAVLTGLLGMVLSGVVANLAVGWYRISSFEGGSGYFVVGMALLGLLGGAVIGLVTARTMAGGDPGLIKVLATSGGLVLAVVGGIGAVSRLLADVPPTANGEEMYIAFELRWPEKEMRSPADFPGEGFARLGAGTSAQVIRKWGDGALFVDDAHQVDGRWVVPGIADVFTSRGDRLLEVGIGDTVLAGFLMNVPAHPGVQDSAWSEWLPRAKPGSPPLPDQYAYRFRVVPKGDPVRTQRVGPFEVATIVSSLFDVERATGKAANSTFTISYEGVPVPGLQSIGAVAVLGGDAPALVVRDGDPNAENARCVVLAESGGTLAVSEVGSCNGAFRAELLTADAAAWHAANDAAPLPGWLDRTMFRIPGLYRLPGGILDTETRAFTAAKTPTDPLPINGLPPVALSPDRRNYVWFAHDGSETHPVLCVTNWTEDTTYTVAIDRGRMRYSGYTQIDPAWVAHHFAWVRGTDGRERLTARTDFTPLPYRGEREVDHAGKVTAYYLRPGGTALRNAMVEVMVSELGGERMPDELNGYHRVVKFDGKLVKAAFVDGGGFVSISMDFGTVDSELIARLADRLDTIIATGKYDSLFHVD